MQTLISDLRHGLRSFRRSPVLPLFTVLALSLGIGAITAAFGTMDALVLHAYRMPDAERVVQLWGRTPAGDPQYEAQISTPTFEDYAAQQTSFDLFAAFRFGQVFLDTGERYEEMSSMVASHELLPLLGVRPVLGRNFTPEESRAGAGQVILISHEVWQDRFGGGPDAVGRVIELTSWSDEEEKNLPLPFEIVGVLPEGFSLPPVKHRHSLQSYPSPAFVTPLGGLGWGRNDRDVWILKVLGRLAPERTLAGARAEMEGIGARLAQAYPDTDYGTSVVVTPLRQIARGQYGRQLVLLWGAALFLLLIACANVAALLIGRAVGRQQDFAVRKALGAGWSRVLRQLLTESGLLAVAGGAGGIALALTGVALFRSLAPAEIPGLQTVGLDLRMLAFTAGAAGLTVLLFGVGPALTVARIDIPRSLRTGGGSRSRGSLRAIRWLVTGQVALAFILLVNGGLLLATLANMLRSDPGFQIEDRYVLKTAPMRPGLTKFETPQELSQLFGRIQEALRAVPGFVAIAYTNNAPLSGRETGSDFSPADRPFIPVEARPAVETMRVSHGYFGTMGIPVLEGEEFPEIYEPPEAEPGVPPPRPVLAEMPLILSAPLARFYWPDESPLGKIGYWGVQDPALAPGGSYAAGWDRTYPPPRPLRVIGVVGSVSQLSMNDPPRLQYYTVGDGFPYLVVHARGDPATVLPQIRNAVEGVDPEVVVLEAAPFTQRVKAVTGATRVQLFLVGLFAAVSTIMAVLGLFGVMEYSVRQRMREMGIRMSTGATGAQVQAMVFTEGIRLVAIGIGLGVLGAWASGRLLRGFLFGVVPWDPKVLAATAAVMAVVALAGCITPTRRAGRVDPVMILRAE